jgi:zinc/manganese transport system substrate-binding protein
MVLIFVKGARNMRRSLVTLLAASLLAAGCGGTDASDRPLVVVTTTVLGDVVTAIAGDEADVEVLLPVGADPHDFQPSARQAARLREAGLVVVNGLGLEGGLEDTIEAAQDDGVRVVAVAPNVDPLPFGEHLDEDDHDESDAEHDHGDLDPHVWMDPLRVAAAARLLGGEMAAIAEGGWVERAEAYAARMEDLDAEIAQMVDRLDPDQKVLVTNHEALGYFADRYAFEIAGVVIPGGSTLGEPSSADLAALVETLRTSGVRAIFAETTEPAALAEAVAGEFGGGLAVVELYTGSLGPDGSGAETLEGLLRTDAQRIVEALS